MILKMVSRLKFLKKTRQELKYYRDILSYIVFKVDCLEQIFNKIYIYFDIGQTKTPKTNCPL